MNPKRIRVQSGADDVPKYDLFYDNELRCENNCDVIGSYFVIGEKYKVGMCLEHVKRQYGSYEVIED